MPNITIDSMNRDTSHTRERDTSHTVVMGQQRTEKRFNQKKGERKRRNEKGYLEEGRGKCGARFTYYIMLTGGLDQKKRKQ